MGKKGKNDKAIILSVVVLGISILIIVVGIIINFNSNRVSELEKMQNVLEHVFFYLPTDNYDDLNSMSDYCKVSMVMNTDYVKDYKLLSTKDYNSFVKENNKNSVKSYSKNDVLLAVKSILGDNAVVNFSKDENGIYNFLVPDSCSSMNDGGTRVLNYNNSLKYFFYIDSDEKNYNKLYVEWGEKQETDNKVVLTAKALLTVKNEDGSYNVYSEYGNDSFVGKIDSGADIKTEIDNLMFKSNDYTITLTKKDKSYVWTGYSVVKNTSLEEIIYD